jgi:WD40 repeat protein
MVGKACRFDSKKAPLQRLEDHSGGVESVAFSPDGKQVVSGSDSGTIRLWDTATGAPLQRLRGPGLGLVSSLLTRRQAGRYYISTIIFSL